MLNKRRRIFLGFSLVSVEPYRLGMGYRFDPLIDLLGKIPALLVKKLNHCQ